MIRDSIGYLKMQISRPFKMSTNLMNYISAIGYE